MFLVCSACVRVRVDDDGLILSSDGPVVLKILLSPPPRRRLPNLLATCLEGICMFPCQLPFYMFSQCLRLSGGVGVDLFDMTPPRAPSRGLPRLFATPGAILETRQGGSGASLPLPGYAFAVLPSSPPPACYCYIPCKRRVVCAFMLNASSKPFYFHRRRAIFAAVLESTGRGREGRGGRGER